MFRSHFNHRTSEIDGSSVCALVAFETTHEVLQAAHRDIDHERGGRAAFIEPDWYGFSFQS